MSFLNVLRLTTRIYPDKAGPAVYAYQLSEHISNKNFKMYNITCRPEGIFDKEKQVNNHFKIEYIPIKATRWDAGSLKQLLFLIRFGMYSFTKVLKLHRKYRIDLIHCDNPAITGFIASIFNLIFKIPVIYTQHGLDSHFKLNFLLEIKIIYPRSTNYIIVSRKMIPFFKKNKLDTKKLIWIPIGIDLKNFFHVKTKEEKEKIISNLNLNSILKIDDIIVIYVGYMDLEQKVLGMIDFLYGFKDFLIELNESERKKIKLIFLGDGKYKNLLEKELNNLNLKNNIYLLGVRLEIERFYAISDFLALTSYIEGFPTVLLEAIASNIPCICTDVGEVNEILDTRSIIPCGKRKEITNKLKLFYNDKNVCKQIVDSSFNKIKKFDWLYITEEIRKVYKNTIFKNIKKNDKK